MKARLIEVACDESGFSGSNLLDANTEVFAYASVHLSAESASQCVDVVRARSQHRSVEYKSNQLLRSKQRPVLTWLLGPSGPIYGNAHVHLTDKTFFVVARIIDLLLGEPSYTVGTSLDRDRRVTGIAVTLYRQGPGKFGRDPWCAFLEAFITLMRIKRRRQDIGASVDAFFRTLIELRLPDSPDRIGEIVTALRRARSRLDSLETRLLDGRRMLPPLEPLIPAIVETALYWGAGGRSVSIVHDEQSALTEHRVAQIKELLVAPRPAHLHGLQSGRLLGVRLVDSCSDPRVQVADFLAGAARRIASDELRGKGDPELTALLRPYVDPSSIWADNASWHRRPTAPGARL